MIETNYGEVRQAYISLTTLSREKMQITLGAALKWKRILGVLRPLVEQMEELQTEALHQYAEIGADGQPVKGEALGTVRLADVEGYSKAVQEMLATPVQVGSDLVEASDFGEMEKVVDSNLVERLVELGPLFRDATEGAG